MKNTAIMILFTIALLMGCKRSSGSAFDESVVLCERRLSAKSVSESKARSFCACFVSAATKKYSPTDLLKELRSGSDKVFKDSLSNEFQACKAAPAIAK